MPVALADQTAASASSAVGYEEADARSRDGSAELVLLSRVPLAQLVHAEHELGQCLAMIVEADALPLERAAALVRSPHPAVQPAKASRDSPVSFDYAIRRPKLRVIGRQPG